MTIVLFQVLGAFANRPLDAVVNGADPTIGVNDVSLTFSCVCCVCLGWRGGGGRGRGRGRGGFNGMECVCMVTSYVVLPFLGGRGGGEDSIEWSVCAW